MVSLCAAVSQHILYQCGAVRWTVLSGAYDDSCFYLSVYVGLMIWKGEDAHMFTDGQIYMGLAEGQRVHMQLAMSNRHGLIAGASGTGRTITMKTMAESFSDAGVPVFLCM